MVVWCRVWRYDKTKGGHRHHRVSAAGTRSRVITPDHINQFPGLADAIVVTRNEWLGHGLRAMPSDRATAETAITEIYARCGCSPPRFEWYPSPSAAIDTIAPQYPPSTVADVLTSPSGLISELITSTVKGMNARLCLPELGVEALSTTEATRFSSPQEAADNGAPPGHIVEATVWESLQTTLIDGVAQPIRRLINRSVGAISWYGQHEAHRFAAYDAFSRHRLVTFHPDDNDVLDLFTAITASTGWWWALPEVCVMAERPIAVHTEPIPGGYHGERRPHHEDAPAIEFSDGLCLFSIHGTVVPRWVVTDPTIDRIWDERNVEIRRTAIERIGWDAYIDAAGFTLIDTAHDPGNPGCLLRLYALADEWVENARILLVDNGSVERDGRRRRYGLYVPTYISGALAAAGWTYGIAGDDYARLARRT